MTRIIIECLIPGCGYERVTGTKNGVVEVGEEVEHHRRELGARRYGHTDFRVRGENGKSGLLKVGNGLRGVIWDKK